MELQFFLNPMFGFYVLFYFFNFFLYTYVIVIIPFGKFGLPYLCKATADAGAMLPSPTSACWVFSCRNPPHSDMLWTTGSLLILSEITVSACVGHTKQDF